MVGSRTLKALLEGTRPRQWSKNVLVAAAPLSAGVLVESTVWVRVLAAFASFVAASAAVYLLNDVCDREHDRRHPLKRDRPVASGRLPVGVAVVAAGVAALLSLGIGLAVAPDLAVVMAVYLVSQVAYSYWLKQQPVLDIAVVSLAFLLRAVAGGVAAQVELSQWFLLVASFGSLLVVAGKRFSELVRLGADAGTRASLTMYSESYLRFVWSLAAAVTVTAYSLWAFEIAPPTGVPWQAVSIAPFTIAILRYAADVDRGVAGEPEEVVLRDHVLQVIGIVWLACFVLGVAARG
ncbi:decaprenyl-phosphate phosphoribosyltransferase [Solicola sp. PLA-1-18]|uniref:decaprenyl-phosphate phosphoribosyltransferase n=1 Tax=Solicola sp. PLA-1-18 TaxID=3380532 RepID=UPI003B7CF52F